MWIFGAVYGVVFGVYNFIFKERPNRLIFRVLNAKRLFKTTFCYKLF